MIFRDPSVADSSLATDVLVCLRASKPEIILQYTGYIQKPTTNPASPRIGLSVGWFSSDRPELPAALAIASSLMCQVCFGRHALHFS
ncbi:hypothetical protein PoB_002430900 [Plakobranchus ocellatus]|uniref:Uncharacterized protein n=1 Tax=Plakobranchus ocellatus TaxID=259542 RepID=A0AAV3ZTS1_9GAST|nr:hypothetical protein PoB_002430900 [Plakobranchus ocellatus]